MTRKLLGFISLITLTLGADAGTNFDPAELSRLLRARDFPALEARLAPHRAPSDRQSEQAVARIWRAFRVADESLAPHFDAWIEAYPDSPSPWLARALHRYAVGWRQRGNRYVSDTADVRLARFEAALLDASSDVRRTLKLENRSIEAHVLAIWIGMALGDDCEPMFNVGVAAAPFSVRLHAHYAGCFEPRWGGTAEGFHAFLQRVKREHPNDPELRFLAGFPDAWRGYQLWLDDEYKETLAAYKRALDNGEYWAWHGQRAETYLALKSYALALEEANAALVLWPDYPESLALRAQALHGLGRDAEARAALSRAASLDWLDREVIYAQGKLARPLYEKGYEIEKAGKTAEARKLYDEAVALAPQSSWAHYYRGMYFTRSGDANAAERDLHRAVALEPDERAFCIAYDRLLSKQRRWDEIGVVWDEYLRLVPDDAEGYFERGGTNYNRGRRDAAQADLSKACSLGRKQACFYKVILWFGG